MIRADGLFHDFQRSLVQRFGIGIFGLNSVDLG
jgi:hypothetical protein